MFLCAANPSVFEAMLVSYMRPFFVLLGLLLCMTTTRADEQMVIKDSEAIRNVGRYVEVCGLVVSVTSSPLGTTFINFGREYPNQTFAGFISADSGITADQITKLEGKNICIVGTIELHKGKPEVKIMSMYQIVDLSSKLAE
jgi:DNA/RNA endonuclease YhcR with UshA esterase domain